MDFTAVYPKIEPKPNLRLIWRQIVLFALFAGCLVSGIVNLCLGGSPWSLYVFGGAVVFWAIFLYHPMVEFSLLQKASGILLSVASYLFLIDWLTPAPNWSNLVVPIVLFSAFVLMLLLFFLRFSRQKHNVFPLYLISLLILVLIVFAACGLFTLRFNWPVIVLAALDGLLFLVTAVFFREPILREFKKKFHTK